MMTDVSTTIRTATTTDAALLAELGRITFLQAFTGKIREEDLVAFCSNRFEQKQQASELADPNSKLFVAERGNVAIGYAKLRISEAPSCIFGRRPIELERLYMSQEHVGCGVGRLLMQACFDEAIRDGCDVMWLDVWDQNQGARRFYRRYGFVEAGTRPYTVGQDIQTHVLMILGLSSTAALKPGVAE